MSKIDWEKIVKNEPQLQIFDDSASDDYPAKVGCTVTVVDFQLSDYINKLLIVVLSSGKILEGEITKAIDKKTSLFWDHEEGYSLIKKDDIQNIHVVNRIF